MSDKRKHVPYLDGWRGAAILCVLIGHFGPKQYWYVGRFGVVLFFVLSGMFMAKLLFIDKVRLDVFFARRASRILPLCWIYLVVMYISSTISPPAIALNTDVLISSFFFLGTYVPKDASLFESGFNLGHLWSLNVEEHSYMYLALGAVVLARLRSKRAIEIFLALTSLLIVAVIFLYVHGMPAYGALSFRNHTEVAALGIMASAALTVYGSGRTSLSSAPTWMPVLVLMLAFWVATPNFPRPTTNSYTYLTLIACPLLAAYAMSKIEIFPEMVKVFLSSKIMRWFGTLSFSIYIWQQPFYQLLLDHKIGNLSAVSISLAVAVFSFYCIENPARVFINGKLTNYLENRKQRGIAKTDVAA